MSSHREAPEISKDPVADSTDVYAFVSPDKPGTVTIIANYIPLEAPAGGPNFFEFGDDVLYSINIDNDGDGRADVSYQLRFTTTVADPNTFLYNTGQVTSLSSPNWNRRQTYSVTRVVSGRNGSSRQEQLATGVQCPPCNVGPRSMPSYAALAQAAITTLTTGETVFAGQRAEGFYVDLGSVFDLADLRPFQNLHLIPSGAVPGVDPLKSVNVHSIAIQIPIQRVTRNGSVPNNVSDPNAVIGVWTAASRRKVSVGREDVGPWMQVSRLGNPLFNEVIVPMSAKDAWNALPPSADGGFAKYVTKPELAGLLPVLYPGVFPNLGAYTKARADLQAILLTGIPAGIIPGFQNYTGSTLADELRLNLAVPPAAKSIYGLLGGDLAGFPNGRRVSDDVVAIELRAIAGVTIPLVDPSFTPDGAAALVTDGTAPHTYLPSFPYLNTPYDGYDTPSS